MILPVKEEEEEEKVVDACGICSGGQNKSSAGQNEFISADENVAVDINVGIHYRFVFCAFGFLFFFFFFSCIFPYKRRKGRLYKRHKKYYNLYDEISFASKQTFYLRFATNSRLFAMCINVVSRSHIKFQMARQYMNTPMQLSYIQ